MTVNIINNQAEKKMRFAIMSSIREQRAYENIIRREEMIRADKEYRETIEHDEAIRCDCDEAYDEFKFSSVYINEANKDIFVNFVTESERIDFIVDKYECV